jgi:hypothetical protein
MGITFPVIAAVNYFFGNPGQLAPDLSQRIQIDLAGFFVFELFDHKKLISLYDLWRSSSVIVDDIFTVNTDKLILSHKPNHVKIQCWKNLVFVELIKK